MNPNTEIKRPRGRPMLFAIKLVRIMVTLDLATIAKAKALGAGNLSAGIRAAIKRITD